MRRPQVGELYLMKKDEADAATADAMARIDGLKGGIAALHGDLEAVKGRMDHALELKRVADAHLDTLEQVNMQLWTAFVQAAGECPRHPLLQKLVSVLMSEFQNKPQQALQQQQ